MLAGIKHHEMMAAVAMIAAEKSQAENQLK